MSKLLKGIFVVIVGSIALSSIHCGSSYAPPHPTPLVTDTDSCDAAQKNLLKLNCALGQPTAKGLSFGDFCRQTQNNGIEIDPKCLAGITDCESANLCNKPTK
jgi:hypothetical protein